MIGLAKVKSKLLGMIYGKLVYDHDAPRPPEPTAVNPVMHVPPPETVFVSAFGEPTHASLPDHVRRIWAAYGRYRLVHPLLGRLLLYGIVLLIAVPGGALIDVSVKHHLSDPGTGVTGNAAASGSQSGSQGDSSAVSGSGNGASGKDQSTGSPSSGSTNANSSESGSKSAAKTKSPGTQSKSGGSSSSGSLSSGSPGSGGQSGSSGNPTGEFYIVGDKIVAPDGSLYFPQGANLATPDTLNTPYNAVGRSADVQAWGWNTVRLVTMCTKDGASWDYISENSEAAFESMLEGLIQEYTNKHIVVDVTCFDTSYGASNYSAVMPELNSFWTWMGDTYKNNPYVWFDPMNEGFWEQPASTFVSWYNSMYDTIRNTGAENIMVVDVENAGNDAGWGNTPQIFTSSSGPEIASGKCNVLFAMHNYGGLSDNIANYTDYSVYGSYWQAVQAANLAMFIEEYGYTVSSPAQDNQAGANATWQEAVKYGIGGLWWAGISNDGFSLKSDGGIFDEGGNDVNLSAAGQAVWNYSHTTHNLGQFTGSYSQSNCASTR